MTTTQSDFTRACGPMYGAVFLSALMSTGFYGTTCMQTFFYYVHYRNDPLRIKSFVAAVWALNTIHEGLIISGGYKYIMAGLVNLQTVTQGVPELVVLSTALVAIPTQGFFIYRIYVFSGKNIATPLLWVPLAIYQLVSAILYAAKALYYDDGLHVAKLDERFFQDMAVSYLSVAAAVDILTSVFLTALLVRKRTAFGYSRTAHILQRLVVFAINTGIWTAFFALLTLIFLHAHPSTLVYTVFGVPLCSIYCNTLLANLNVRGYIRDEIATHNVDLPVPDGCEIKPRPESGKTQLYPMSEHSELHRGVSFQPTDTSRTEESAIV